MLYTALAAGVSVHDTTWLAGSLARRGPATASPIDYDCTTLNSMFAAVVMIVSNAALL